MDRGPGEFGIENVSRAPVLKVPGRTGICAPPPHTQRAPCSPCSDSLEKRGAQSGIDPFCRSAVQADSTGRSRAVTGGIPERRSLLRSLPGKGIPMSRTVLSRSLCLIGLCGLYSCSKKEAPATAETAPTPPAQTSAANQQAAPAAGKDDIRVTTDAQGRKNVTLNPKQAEALADTLIAKGQLRQALEILSRLIQMNPKATDAYVKRAAILAESKLLTQAIADMTKAITLVPSNARMRNTRGYFYLSAQSYDEAFQDFSDAIGLDDKFAQAYNNRGLVRIAKKEFAGSLKDFDQALTLDPQYVDACNNKGYALMSMEKFPESIAEFSRAIEINPKYVNGWNNRGQAYMKANQPEKAAADFSEAIKLVPGNTSYIAARAEAYAAAGKTAEAQSDRDRAKWLSQLAKLTAQLQQNPKVAATWIARGRHLLSSGELGPALGDFQRASKVAPDNMEAQCGIAATLLAMGKTDDSIATCNNVLAKGPMPIAFSIRGEGYFKKGFLDEAIEDFTAAKRRDSQVAQAFRMRAEKRKAQGDAAHADEDLAAAAELETTPGAVRQVSGEAPALK